MAARPSTTHITMPFSFSIKMDAKPMAATMMPKPPTKEE